MEMWFGLVKAQVCVCAYAACCWGSDFQCRSEKDTAISGDFWNTGCVSMWSFGHMGPRWDLADVLCLRAKQKISCLPASISCTHLEILSKVTPEAMAEAQFQCYQFPEDFELLGKNPHWMDGFTEWEGCV